MERSLECLSGKRCPSSWTHMVIVGECGPCIPQCQRHRLTLMFIFLVTNPYQPCIHTRQITQKHFKRIMLSNARRWQRGGELGAGGVRGPCDTSVCVTRMQEMLCAFVISCWSHVLILYSLSSCDWHMAFLHAVSPAVPLKQWYYEWVQS